MASGRQISLVALVALSSCHGAYAANWNAEGGVQARVGYDGNLRFTPDDSLDSARSTYTLETRFSRETEQTLSSLDLDYSFLNADEAEFADSEDYAIEFASAWQGERFGASITAAERRANTLTTIFVDTGFIDLGVQREQRTVAPALSWQASEKISYTVAASDERVEYLQETALVDYEFSGVSLERRVILTPRSQYFVSLGQSQLDAPDARSTNDVISLSLGYSHQVSESLSWEVSAGGNRTETDRVVRFIVFDVPVTDEDDGWRASANVTKRWTYTTLQLSASQQLQPSGQGSLTERQLVTADIAHRLSPKFSLGLNMQFNRFDEPGTLDGLSDDRDYARAALRFVYTPHPSWRIQLDAIHDTQTFDRSQDVARRDSAFLTVRYQGGRR